MVQKIPITVNPYINVMRNHYWNKLPYVACFNQNLVKPET